MLPQTSFCIFLLAMTYLNRIHALAVPTSELEEQNKKFADGYLLERFGVNPHRLFDDDNVDEDDFIHQKRQLKKKWTKFHHGAQSPYTIAFPALIRTRRSSQ